jgi:hypothetical protein
MLGLGLYWAAAATLQVPFPSRLGDPDEYAQLAEHIISNVRSPITSCTSFRTVVSCD